MNKILFVVALLLCGKVQAQQLTSAQAVASTVRYQTSCSSTTIGTTAADVTGNTTSIATTAAVSSVKVSNADPAATICCSHSASVTCLTGAATDGDSIYAAASSQKNFLMWPISILQKWYCVATVQGAGAIVCKVR